MSRSMPQPKIRCPGVEEVTSTTSSRLARYCERGGAGAPVTRVVQGKGYSEEKRCAGYFNKLLTDIRRKLPVNQFCEQYTRPLSTKN